MDLSAINVSGALADVLEPHQATWPYGAETAAIAGDLVLLIVLFQRQSAAARDVPRPGR